MRIGIACYPTYGGSGVVASELGIELAKVGHEVHVMSYALPFRLEGYTERIYYHEIEVSSYPLFKYPPFTLSAACKMIEIAETHRLDVIHVHYAIPWAICAHLAREVMVSDGMQNLKVVTTLHGTDITLVGSEPEFFKMTRHGILRSDGVTAVSQYLKNETRKTFNVECPIDVIHNFIDPDRFKPYTEGGGPCNRKVLAPDGEKLLIHVSNFRPVKNIPDVIKTFALLRKNVKTRLLMVGEGPELAGARALARKLGVQKDVIFMGKQQSVEDILACADLFILPSSYESFGLSALEAMSCGLPVIATDAGGLSEVVTAGVDGWLCSVGDTACMAERATDLLSNDARRATMSAAARKKAVDQFNISRIVPQYEALYQRVLNAKG